MWETIEPENAEHSVVDKEPSSRQRKPAGTTVNVIAGSLPSKSSKSIDWISPTPAWLQDTSTCILWQSYARPRHPSFWFSSLLKQSIFQPRLLLIPWKMFTLYCFSVSVFKRSNLTLIQDPIELYSKKSSLSAGFRLRQCPNFPFAYQALSKLWRKSIFVVLNPNAAQFLQQRNPFFRQSFGWK